MRAIAKTCGLLQNNYTHYIITHSINSKFVNSKYWCIRNIAFSGKLIRFKTRKLIEINSHQLGMCTLMNIAYCLKFCIVVWLKNLFVWLNWMHTEWWMIRNIALVFCRYFFIYGVSWAIFCLVASFHFHFLSITGAFCYNLIWTCSVQIRFRSAT